MAKVDLPTQHATPLRCVINMKSVGLSPEKFFQLCRDNPDTRIEMTAQKELIVRSPTGKPTAIMNAEITRQLGNWADEDGRGYAFDSNALFNLENGARRSPDAAWMTKSKYEAIPDPGDFLSAGCPDFVVELWSPSDILKELHTKMAEYMACGAQLGFLLYPRKRQVGIYRLNQAPEKLDNPAFVSGDPVLPGFKLDLTKVWR
jgi:Uma2 family endonuclease